MSEQNKGDYESSDWKGPALAHLTERFDERVRDIAFRLRELADEVEREGLKPQANRVGAPEYGWKFTSVLHAVTWAVPNLNLTGLADLAAELDRYEGEHNASSLPPDGAA